MENIYIGHSRNYDFKNELYLPIRKSSLNSKFNIVLPHESSDSPYDSKNFLKSCKYMIAEVSYPGIGLGIELGWADIYDVKIVCIYKKGFKVSGSLTVVADIFIEYESEKELISKLQNLLE